MSYFTKANDQIIYGCIYRVAFNYSLYIGLALSMIN